MEKLKEVIDPELGVDIVSLGLVYKVTVNGPPSSTRLPARQGLRRVNKSKQEKQSGCVVKVEMTLTSPGCPLAPVIHRLVEDVLMNLPGVDDVELVIVWDPPWSMDRVSEEVRLMLGF